MALYSTPISILHFLGHHCSVNWPRAFGHNNPNSPQLPLPLAAMIACGTQESLLIKTYPLCLIVRPYVDNYKLSYNTTLSTTNTILPGLDTAE